MLEHDDFVLSALLEESAITPAQADDARRAAAEQKLRPVAVLVQRGIVTPRAVAMIRAAISECPFVDPEQFTIDIRNAGRLPRASAESLEAFLLFDTGDTATVAMANPLDLRAVDQLRSLLSCDVEPVLCEPEAIARLIERAYALTGQFAGAGTADADAAQRDGLDAATSKEPIVAAVHQIIAQGIERGASDIHLGPDENQLHLRYRIDGILQPQQAPVLAAHAGLVQRLKVMANLDLTQTRRPQDGKFRFTHRARAVDIRLSLIPTVCGENVVMRLLTSSGNIRGFAELGVQPAHAHAIESLLDHPHGIILVTGPTGSGKTTTLYTALKRLNTPERNIITIEDPVEVRMPLVRQVPVNAEIGMTFAAALRSVLRQDPDVVFVGEIRDDETARIAIQAALTGHLVLSSLHTNDACGAIPRLRDLGVPGFAINAALLGVVAQRLVRRVCPECAKPAHPSAELARQFVQSGAAAARTPQTTASSAAHDDSFVEGVGCPRCTSTGYRGRVGLYEVLTMAPPIQDAVNNAAPIDQLRRIALRAGMRPMRSDGYEKARIGLTSLSEVARVTAAIAVDEAADNAPNPHGGSGVSASTPAPAAPRRAA